MARVFFFDKAASPLDATPALLLVRCARSGSGTRSRGRPWRRCRASTPRAWRSSASAPTAAGSPRYARAHAHTRTLSLSRPWGGWAGAAAVSSINSPKGRTWDSGESPTRTGPLLRPSPSLLSFTPRFSFVPLLALLPPSPRPPLGWVAASPRPTRQVGSDEFHSVAVYLSPSGSWTEGAAGGIVRVASTDTVRSQIRSDKIG